MLKKFILHNNQCPMSLTVGGRKLSTYYPQKLARRKRVGHIPEDVWFASKFGVLFNVSIFIDLQLYLQISFINRPETSRV